MTSGDTVTVCVIVTDITGHETYILFDEFDFFRIVYHADTVALPASA